MLQLRSATELLLDSVLSLMGTAMNPTLPNLLSLSGQLTSRPQIRRLEEAGYLSKEKNAAGRWVYQLTRKGALAALGGRNPAECWSRTWDGNWRFVLFDLPRKSHNERRKLHRWFRKRHFGCLQGSVWISPDSVDDIAPLLEDIEAGAEAVLAIEGLPVAPAHDNARKIVEKAWDFIEINRRYEEYLAIASSAQRPVSSESERQAQHLAWMHAVKLDPLLPADLLPQDYLGRKAWSQRSKLLQRSGTSL